MTTIVAEHITKRFDHDARPVTAVDNLSLRIQSGEVLAILGPSGCGKSTLLRLIAGIYKPDDGHVYYDQRNLQEIPLQERGIGMVFQEGALIPHWDSEHNIGFFLRLRHRENEIPERIRQVAKITGIGLEYLLPRRPRTLSGGEQQRVSIARALARDLNVLLFDEPFANLDAPVRATARVELKRLLMQFPATAVYVTHDQHEAIALSHRIAVMRAGRIAQIGTYEQLYSSPINTFVATFVGTPTMNLFNGCIREGKWVGENFGGFPIRGDLPDGMAVTVGVRPDQITLDRGGTPGVIDEVERHYAERYQLVTVHLGGERWTIQRPLEEHFEVGVTLYCALQPDSLLYFEGTTGMRVGSSGS